MHFKINIYVWIWICIDKSGRDRILNFFKKNNFACSFLDNSQKNINFFIQNPKRKGKIEYTEGGNSEPTRIECNT